jgi:hypothetical protein
MAGVFIYVEAPQIEGDLHRRVIVTKVNKYYPSNIITCFVLYYHITYLVTRFGLYVSHSQTAYINKVESSTNLIQKYIKIYLNRDIRQHGLM